MERETIESRVRLACDGAALSRDWLSHGCIGRGSGPIQALAGPTAGGRSTIPNGAPTHACPPPSPSCTPTSLRHTLHPSLNKMAASSAPATESTPLLSSAAPTPAGGSTGASPSPSPVVGQKGLRNPFRRLVITCFLLSTAFFYTASIILVEFRSVLAHSERRASRRQTERSA